MVTAITVLTATYSGDWSVAVMLNLCVAMVTVLTVVTDSVEDSSGRTDSTVVTGNDRQWTGNTRQPQYSRFWWL